MYLDDDTDELVWATADIKALYPVFKSKLEERFNDDGVMLIDTDQYFPDGVRVHQMDYEPESFKLPGGSYTPDFRIILDSGRIVFVEIKGSTKQKNYRDARAKLRAAAHVNPFYHWMECRWTKRTGWIIDHIN